MCKSLAGGFSDAEAESGRERAPIETDFSSGPARSAAEGNGIWDGEGTDKAYVFGQAGDAPVVGKW